MVIISGWCTQVSSAFSDLLQPKLFWYMLHHILVKSIWGNECKSEDGGLIKLFNCCRNSVRWLFATMCALFSSSSSQQAASGGDWIPRPDVQNVTVLIAGSLPDYHSRQSLISTEWPNKSLNKHSINHIICSSEDIFPPLTSMHAADTIK